VDLGSPRAAAADPEQSVRDQQVDDNHDIDGQRQQLSTEIDAVSSMISNGMKTEASTTVRYSAIAWRTKGLPLRPR